MNEDRPGWGVGHWMLAIGLVFTVIYALSQDTGSTHLFNPLWHPHARFHLAQMLAMLTIMVATGLWLLARGGRPGVIAAAALLIAFWSPMLWISFVLPGLSPLAGPSIPVLRLGGLTIYVNILLAAVGTAWALIGWRLADRPRDRA
ncbi:hypothetical protein [uncultured Sphingomonas sp.]|uniref:hypothetical protein n=1 Tax=uncultured Sphingomonas sp. TaxID=158754 RepID=UPI0035CC1B98